jgi:hypothetical protein
MFSATRALSIAFSSGVVGPGATVSAIGAAIDPTESSAKIEDRMVENFMLKDGSGCDMGCGLVSISNKFRKRNFTSL